MEGSQTCFLQCFDRSEQSCLYHDAEKEITPCKDQRLLILHNSTSAHFFSGILVPAETAAPRMREVGFQQQERSAKQAPQTPRQNPRTSGFQQGSSFWGPTLGVSTRSTAALGPPPGQSLALCALLVQDLEVAVVTWAAPQGEFLALWSWQNTYHTCTNVYDLRAERGGPGRPPI